MKYWAEFDSKAIKADRLLHPKKSHNIWGEPCWHGSDAQAYLKVDMAAGELEKKTQTKLWNHRPAYQLFCFVIFRKHIDQALQSAKPHKNERRHKKGHYGDKKLSENQTSDTSTAVMETNKSK